jgi:hypothetical protein
MAFIPKLRAKALDGISEQAADFLGQIMLPHLRLHLFIKLLPPLGFKQSALFFA